MGSAVPLLVVRWRPLTCPLRPGPDTAPRVSLGAHPPRRVEGALHGLLVCGERRRIRERPRAGRSVFSDHDQDDPATRGRPRDEDPLGRTFEQPEVGHAGLSVGRAEHATTAHVKSCSPVVRRARIACCPRRAGRLMGYTRVMSVTVGPPRRPGRAKRSRPLGRGHAHHRCAMPALRHAAAVRRPANRSYSVAVVLRARARVPLVRCASGDAEPIARADESVTAA